MLPRYLAAASLPLLLLSVIFFAFLAAHSPPVLIVSAVFQAALLLALLLFTIFTPQCLAPRPRPTMIFALSLSAGLLIAVNVVTAVAVAVAPHTSSAWPPALVFWLLALASQLVTYFASAVTLCSSKQPVPASHRQSLDPTTPQPPTLPLPGSYFAAKASPPISEDPPPTAVRHSLQRRSENSSQTSLPANRAASAMNSHARLCSTASDDTPGSVLHGSRSLPTIPGSRSPSPAKALEGPFAADDNVGTYSEQACTADLEPEGARPDQENTESNVSNTQSSAKNTQINAENTQSNVNNTQSNVKNTQSNVNTTQTNAENTQINAENTQSNAENTQINAENAQSNVNHTQINVKNTQSNVKQTSQPKQSPQPKQSSQTRISTRHDASPRKRNSLRTQPNPRRGAGTRNYHTEPARRESRRAPIATHNFSRLASARSEEHIHPLFRTTSPVPPPGASSNTTVTAAPQAGRFVHQRTLRRYNHQPPSPSSLIRCESSPDFRRSSRTQSWTIATDRSPQQSPRQSSAHTSGKSASSAPRQHPSPGTSSPTSTNVRLPLSPRSGNAQRLAHARKRSVSLESAVRRRVYN